MTDEKYVPGEVKSVPLAGTTSPRPDYAIDLGSIDARTLPQLSTRDLTSIGFLVQVTDKSIALPPERKEGKLEWLAERGVNLLFSETRPISYAEAVAHAFYTHGFMTAPPTQHIPAYQENRRHFLELMGLVKPE